MTTETDTGPVRQLTKSQRRVLGVLLEKAFTTPEAYPLTLKGLTTGCNQKSNRSPLSSYEEGGVYDTIEELRALGLAAVVHTESGRTERFRHYVRKKFTFTEPQLAILTELMLRGRQTLGELRARASRMVPIESLTELRNELDSLLNQGYLQATADLERRGTEVDHTFYEPQENKDLEVRASGAGKTSPSAGTTAHSAEGSSNPASSTGESISELAVYSAPEESTPALSDQHKQLEQDVQELRQENNQLKQDLQELQTQLDDLTQQVSDIRRDLGM
ncbi:hypothetical protein Pla110_06500 [Polystyrenella longa]|uniref:DUF480 domain-containing protein n=1 Tax=Polystyrenella longa TaxID=2528007 RepID=A0A518CI88_9PLAN|nr:DUF480 domain-containing protein [Polystyrenella longa]QDU78946.1 hypothetical protein Pla110_06500 [Polystyrenella longa]